MAGRNDGYKLGEKKIVYTGRKKSGSSGEEHEDTEQGNWPFFGARGKWPKKGEPVDTDRKKMDKVPGNRFRWGRKSYSYYRADRKR